MMYPGPSKSKANHKKGVCSDGAMQRLSKNSEQNEDPPHAGDSAKILAPPDWPQPKGLFDDTRGGVQFNPAVLLEHIPVAYGRIIRQEAEGVDLEQDAFARLLTRRLVEDKDGTAYFKLFDIENVPTASQVPVVVYNDNQHIRIDCLQPRRDSNPDSSAEAGLGGPSGSGSH